MRKYEILLFHFCLTCARAFAERRWEMLNDESQLRVWVFQ